MSKLTKQEALERLKYTCSRSEKCIYDIKQKLQNWGLSESFEEISAILIQERFIDENRYVQSFVNDKIRFSKWGKIKVKYNLSMKGIEHTLISNSLNSFPKEDYIEILKNELEKKQKSIKETDKYKRLQKLYMFASQRGYEQEIVREIIQE